NDTACYAGHCHALLNGSAKADQPNIKVPTLVLVGDQDGVTPLASARAIAAAVPGARVRIIPATAHMTMLERPETFNAPLVEFLAGICLFSLPPPSPGEGREKSYHEYSP